MTHLLQYFPQLSLRPENLPELRSLILQLAVEGKLTAEWRKANPDVEPASELLARIEAEKAELVKAKKIKKSKPLPPVSAEEMPLELPEGWVWCRLGEISEILNGRAYKKQELLEDESLTPVLRVGNLFTSKKWYYSDLELPDEKYCEKGDLLYAWSASFGPFIWDGPKSIYHYHIWKLPHTDKVNKEFLYYLLLSDTEKIKASGHGVSMTHMTKAKMTLFEFPLPPLPEQQAIVQTVDALLQELDQLQQRTEARLQLKADYATAALRRLTTAPAVGPAWEALAPHFRTFFDETGNVQSLRAAILQLAVQGKLTAQWRKAHPDVEPATELLSRIQAEKAALVKAKKIKKEKPLPPVDMDEVPFGVPEGWVWCRLGQMTEVITKGSSPKWQGVSYVSEDEGILFITSENVGNYSLLLEKKKYVESKFNDIEPRSILRRDDILMNIVGGSIGRTAIFDLDIVANINQAVTIIRLMDKCFHQYFLHFFNSPLCISYMYDKQVDNARPNLSMGNIAKFMIPIPPLPEQHAIVQAVEELLGLCTALEEAAGRRDVVLGDWVRAVVAGG